MKQISNEKLKELNQLIKSIERDLIQIKYQSEESSAISKTSCKFSP